MSRFVTVHVVNALPLHNLNRDQNGLPKSQFDGGVQRARLSAQSLKRAARVAFRDAGYDQSLRTRYAVAETLNLANDYAAEQGLPFDAAKGQTSIKKVIDALCKSEDRQEAKKAAAEKDGKDVKDSDNIIFLSRTELLALAHSTVNMQQDEAEPSLDHLVADVTSPSLDIAAFGRMFASAPGRGTHAAIAVSAAATSHQMALTADYFSAVEDVAQDHAGAAHIGMSYYTSGVYYRSFTIDVDQLRRSWSAMSGDDATDTFAALIRALIRALPSGKATNTNPYTTPLLVLAETQGIRTAYEFDTPVVAGTDGGYKENTVRALAEQRDTAVNFDPANFGPATLWGNTYGADFHAETATNLDDVIAFITSHVFTAASPTTPVTIPAPAASNGVAAPMQDTLL